MVRIDKEGYKIILYAFLILGAISALFFIVLPLLFSTILSSLLFILFVLIVRFFRVPPREHITEKGAVFSPADGTVVVSEKVYVDEYLKEERIQVSIFMSLWNVHANWFPIEGKVEYFRHHHGQFLVAWHPKSSTENERTSTVVTTDSGVKVMFRQIAGLLAKRIVSYAEEGKTVEQNSRCGFIKFGSRLDLFLPLDSEITVKLGEKVVGSQTVVARLKGE